MTVSYGKVPTASIGAQGGSFPSIGITGKSIDPSVVTRRHDGVRTVTRCEMELQ
jgi:hypothetical protein